MRRILLIIIGIICTLSTLYALEFSFTDVPSNNPYYTAVKDLFEKGKIINTGSNLFHPSAELNNDLYTSLLVGVGCDNAYTPPTPNGNISRLEAAVELLKRANLWNDTLNATNMSNNLSITDVAKTDTMYGYAKKGIEIGILKKRTNGSIGKDETITRGEFALMADKILKYTQCSSNSSPASGTEDSDGDGILDTDDICPNVYGILNGCPRVDTIEYRSSLIGLLSGGNTASSDSFFYGIKQNACLENKLRQGGMIFGSISCTICPCDRSIEMSTPLTSCDIVFPVILSPDNTNIYSRGGFYTIP